MVNEKLNRLVQTKYYIKRTPNQHMILLQSFIPQWVSGLPA